MGKVIAIANQKGGVGKTTTTFNLGAALEERGRSVLVVDLDQQGSLSMSSGLEPDELEQTVYNVLSNYADPKQKKPLQFSEVVLESAAPNMHIIPANIELAALDLELTRAYNREHVLRRALEPVRSSYDYILLDCPPSLGLIVVNALTAADEVLIPLQADYLATKGVRMLIDSIEAVKAQLNPELKIAGILLTLADPRTSHTRQVIDTTREHFSEGVKVFESIIKMSVRLKEAPITGKSVLSYDSKSEAAAAYRQIAEELDNAVSSGSGKKSPATTSA